MTIKSIDVDFDHQEIKSMEQRYRTNFINSLSGYKSANLIGSVAHNGQTNLAMFSSVVHLGAEPALVGFINRPHSVERHTLENICATGFYTINHVAETFFEQAHQTAARYPRAISEFAASGLTEHFTDFKAPYVGESQIKFGVKFIQKVNIELNQTILVIGEIVEVFCPKDWIASDGKIDIAQAKSLAVSGLDEYHRADSLSRLPYPKP